MVFSIIWKLDLALLVGLIIFRCYHRKRFTTTPNYPLTWFSIYMGTMLLLSYLGSFGGIGRIQFPFDLIILAPFSIMALSLSQKILDAKNHQEVICEEGETSLV